MKRGNTIGQSVGDRVVLLDIRWGNKLLQHLRDSNSAGVFFSLNMPERCLTTTRSGRAPKAHIARSAHIGAIHV